MAPALSQLWGFTQADCDPAERTPSAVAGVQAWNCAARRFLSGRRWGADRGKPGRSRRSTACRATPPGATGPRPLAEARLSPAGDALVKGPRRRRRARFRSVPASWPPAAAPARRGPRAMQRLAMDLRMLSRELSLYLEHQVRIGFFGSGVGLSLILGFSFAYACYYMSSIAKVSRGMARAQGRGQLSGSDSSRRSRRCRCLGRVSGAVRGALPPASDGRPLSARDPADLGAAALPCHHSLTW